MKANTGLPTGPGWRLLPSVVIAIAAIVGLNPRAAGAGSGARPPNVVIIVADDLGWGDVRHHRDVRANATPALHHDRMPPFVIQPARGDLLWPDISLDTIPPAIYRRTPTIDRLGDQGIVVGQYLTHSRCSPSRAGLLTGRHYTRVGSGPQTGGTLRLDVSNIARDLQSAGYVTAAFGKWHNGYPNFPADGNGAVVANRDATDPTNDRFENYKGISWGPGVNAYGFDEWQGFYGGAVDYFTRMSTWDADTNWWTNDRYTPWVDGYTTDIVTEAATDFISRNWKAPFFCYVAMPAPHAPYHVLRRDLQELCTRFPGGWDAVRGLTSPSTGRHVEDVEELRCSPGEEFDHTVLDPYGVGFFPLIRATLIYSMDRGVDDILSTLQSLGLTENTIVWLVSDNGLQAGNAAGPLRGGKGTLYEGGIRVPAIVSWPGVLDADTAAYAAGNTYPHVVQYLDVYPTTMSMTGIAPSAHDLDGRDVFDELLTRTPIGLEGESRFVSFVDEVAAVRTESWKLLYNEAGSQQVIELYDLAIDPSEMTDVQASYPWVRDGLIADLWAFIDAGRLAMAYFPSTAEWISASSPAPAAEILEVFAIQEDSIDSGDSHGLFVRFASANLQEFGENDLDPTDLFSFDLYLAADSSLDRGFFVTPAKGWTPVYDSNNGVDHDGALLVDTVWPRERWVRTTVGIGSVAPLGQTVDYIALRSPTSGTYHFFLDNVEIRRADGSLKTVIWASGSDSLRPFYRYDGVRHSRWQSVSAVDGFPFTDLSLRSVECAHRCQDSRASGLVE
jgi:arylsulfatase A-like enzyme